MSNEIDYLRASDGTGEAVRAVVTATRSTSATTLQVDAVTRWPSKFVATAGEYNPETGLIDPATALVFKGSLDGTNLLIDEIAPGYADNGNSVGDVVVIKPASLWADILAEFAERTNTGGVLVNTEYFTSSGTWTKPANLKFVVVEGVGAGGTGGRRGNSATSGFVSAGSGGGGGGYFRKKIDAASLGSTETVTVGEGVAGSSGGTTAPSGGSSSFGSHCTAGGGAGGSYNATTSGTATENGGAGGVATGGDLNIQGQEGQRGVAVASSLVSSTTGSGGSSFMGSGGMGISGASGQQGSPPTVGGGGAGISGATGVSATAGFTGAAGIVIVSEFY